MHNLVHLKPARGDKCTTTRDQGDTTVECHLYDEDALAEAERRRAETPRVTAEL